LIHCLCLSQGSATDDSIDCYASVTVGRSAPSVYTKPDGAKVFIDNYYVSLAIQSVHNSTTNP